MDRSGVESYIVRVYRRDPDGIAGVVEWTRRKRQVTFRSIAQLETILRRGAGSRVRVRGTKRARRT
jgi:hypothetical protein